MIVTRVISHFRHRDLRGNQPLGRAGLDRVATSAPRTIHAATAASPRPRGISTVAPTFFPSADMAEKRQLFGSPTDVSSVKLAPESVLVQMLPPKGATASRFSAATIVVPSAELVMVFQLFPRVDATCRGAVALRVAAARRRRSRRKLE